MLRRRISPLLLLLLVPASAHAQSPENTPTLCQNGQDDDGDGLTDCDDDSCAQLIFCVTRRQAAAEETGEEECHNGADDDGDALVDCDDDGCEVACRRSLTLGQNTERGIYQPRGPDEPTPEVDFVEHETVANYPVAWARHPITLRAGMLVPRVGLEIFGGPGRDALVRLGLGVSYGVFDFWEVTLVAVPLRLAPTLEYANPAISTTFTLFAIPEFELALSANLAIPVAGSRIPAREPLPFATFLSHSAFGDVVELDAALRARIHGGDVLRIDLSVPIASIYFTHDAVTNELDPIVDLTFTADVGVSITDYAFLGVTSGVEVRGQRYEDVIVPFAVFAGAVIPGWRRGPYMDATVRFQFPYLYNSTGVPMEVMTDFWQLTFEFRVFTFLLNDGRG